MKQWLLTFAFLFFLMLCAILIDRLYARFRRHNPSLGPFRDTENGCGCCAGKDHCQDRTSCG